MALPMRLTELYEAGDAWLADCSAHPVLVHAEWDAERLAPITSGGRWLVAETQLVFGMPALSRIREDHRGPVLADPASDTAWWLVPPSAADELTDVRHAKLRPDGWILRCPPTGWALEGRFWLARPDGSGRLTDPAVLAAALGPGGYRHSAEAS
ncbi:hypothetical protein ACWD11_03140 [Streptomyces sp. NPDC002776]